MNENHLAVNALVLLKVTDLLLLAYERATPTIDQELVSRTLGAMQRLRKMANDTLEYSGEARAA